MDQGTESLGNQTPDMLVVSTGRTGTASIAENFRAHYPSIQAVHEPFGSRALRIIGNMFTAGSLDYRSASWVIRLTHGFRRWKIQDRLLIESNPQACCLLPVFCRMYPDTVIVHIVRHPADFIRSYINHGAFNGMKGFLGHRIPYWFLRPEHVHNFDWPPWDVMSPVEASAWRWSALNHIIERDCELWARNYLRVRYEDLFYHGPGEWARISSSCGLDPTRWETNIELARVNASRLSVAPSTESWTGNMKQMIEDRCGEQMKRYGYSLSC